MKIEKVILNEEQSQLNMLLKDTKMLDNILMGYTNKVIGINGKL